MGCTAFDGQMVTGGSILVRQLGNKYFPGKNVGQGKDFTLFAKIPGVVRYSRFGEDKRMVTVIEQPAAQA